MILEKIVANRKRELEISKKLVSLVELENKIKSREKNSFKKALLNEGVSLIAEVKKASPSKGLLRENFEPVQIARCFEKNGAAAISVLTEKTFFQGSLDYLQMINKAVSIPLLRKDFIIDPYQVYEAAAYGADAILLIVSILEKKDFKKLLKLAFELQLDVLVEVHNRKELEDALLSDAKIIGINNRNLHTFETNLKNTLELGKLVPDDRVLVSESGIFTINDIELLKGYGVNAVLIGEALMKSSDIDLRVRELAGR